MGQKPNWKQEEIDYLCNSWGNKPIPTIAKNLGRSVEAVKLKASKLKLRAFLDSSSSVQLNAILNAVGMKGSYTYCTKRFLELGLKVRYQRVINSKFRMVDIEDFWEFAEKHREFFDFSRMEENILGIEPQWVKEKRKQDILHKAAIKPNNTPWTRAEDNYLRDLLKQFRYTGTDIAKRLQRSEGAVLKRMQDLNIEEWPLRNKPVLWTDEEEAELEQMIMGSVRYEIMAERLGRSVKSVQGKVLTTYGRQKLSTVREIIKERNGR